MLEKNTDTRPAKKPEGLGTRFLLASTIKVKN